MPMCEHCPVHPDLSHWKNVIRQCSKTCAMCLGHPAVPLMGKAPSLSCEITVQKKEPIQGDAFKGRFRTCLATIHFSPFTCCFRRFLTPNSQNHSYVHYSLSKFTGEWFTNHPNHIHTFTPITRIGAAKVSDLLGSSHKIH